MKTLKDKLNELLALEAGERPETMLSDLSALVDAEELAYADTDSMLRGELAQALESVEALTKRVQELTAHNYSLMTSVGTPVDNSDKSDETDDVDDPIDSLFGDED